MLTTMSRPNRNSGVLSLNTSSFSQNECGIDALHKANATTDSPA